MYKPCIWHATSQKSHFDKWCTPTCSLNQTPNSSNLTKSQPGSKPWPSKKRRRSGFGFPAPTAASKAQCGGKQTTTFLLSQFLTRADPSSWDRPGWAKKVAGKSSAPRWPVLKRVKCDEFSMWDLGEVVVRSGDCNYLPRIYGLFKARKKKTNRYVTRSNFCGSTIGDLECIAGMHHFLRQKPLLSLLLSSSNRDS